MDVFEDFLQRKTQGSEKAPFFAVIWLHTVHEPHPALPQYYSAYNDSLGNPAGDYLGTLTQMDVQVGRLMDLLKSHGVADNTMVGGRGRFIVAISVSTHQHPPTHSHT